MNRGLAGGSERLVCTSFCQYNDPHIILLGDFLNARAKLRHGALAHIITARILDSHPSSDQLQKLIDNPKLLDKLCAHIAGEVLPGSVSKAGEGSELVNDGDEDNDGETKLPKLPKNNSWSDLLQYERE